jgi:hypothetical protein
MRFLLVNKKLFRRKDAVYNNYYYYYCYIVISNYKAFKIRENALLLRKQIPLKLE